MIAEIIILIIYVSVLFWIAPYFLILVIQYAASLGVTFPERCGYPSMDKSERHDIVKKEITRIARIAGLFAGCVTLILAIALKGSL